MKYVRIHVEYWYIAEVSLHSFLEIKRGYKLRFQISLRHMKHKMIESFEFLIIT